MDDVKVSTVWVTQETPHDFTPANKWGDVHFMTTDDVSNMKNSIRNQDLVDDLRHQLLKFDPENDYLCLTGSPYVSSIVVFHLAAKGLRFLRFLRWSNRDKEYAPVVLDMRGTK